VKPAGFSRSATPAPAAIATATKAAVPARTHFGRRYVRRAMRVNTVVTVR
jgi:hypothetical protein